MLHDHDCTSITNLFSTMNIQHIFDYQLNARILRAADPRTTEGQLVDVSTMDSLNQSLDQLSFDGVMEGHLFQHDYDQFQLDPHTARLWGREEIPRLVMRNEDPNAGRTYNPMIFLDNYSNPARVPPPPPRASEESWI